MEANKIIAEFRQKSAEFQQIAENYKDILRFSIKEIIKRFSDGKRPLVIDIESVANQGYCDRIGKFYCPDDITSNFFLCVIRINANDELVIDAKDFESPDDEYMFCEDELDLADLHIIMENLCNLCEKMEKKEIFISPEGKLFSIEDINEIIDENLSDEYACENQHYYKLSPTGLPEKEIKPEDLLHRVYRFLNND